MSDFKRDCSRMFYVPKTDFSKVEINLDEAACAREAADILAAGRDFDHRAFLKRVREHSECLIAWDCRELFSEYAERVEAGEFD